MADPVTWAIVGATVLSAGAGIMGANAADNAGKAAQAEADYQAHQMEVNAGQERAVSQRKMIEARRQGDLKTSRATAVNASSGGGSLDPSIVNLMGDIGAETDYNVGVAKYEGEEKARDLETGAKIKKWEGAQARKAGKAARNAGYVKVAANVLSSAAQMGGGMGGGAEGSTGTTSMFEKYGGQSNVSYDFNSSTNTVSF